MKIKLLLAACSLTLLAAFTVPAEAARFNDAKSAPEVLCGDYFESNEEAARALVSDEKWERDSARRFLRRQGADGLTAMRKVFAAEIEAHAKGIVSTDEAANARWTLISEAFTAVAQQHDAWSQGAPLFWHTDIESAKRASKKSGKPILSLRLLGKLTDEYSCANSRFFRTALYANAEVAQYLSDNYTLLWTTERPVPKVTIDMGDGRVMTCTITGNSAHYVLDSDGRPLDCIPGLYSPVAFKEAAQRGISLNKELAGKEEAERARLLKLYHKTRLSIINEQFANDLRAAGVDPGNPTEFEKVKDADAEFLRKSGAVGAEVASRRAVSKSRIEEAFFVLIGKYDRAAMESKVTASVWQKIAALHPCTLDEGSIRLMKTQNPETAEEASKRAMSKKMIEDPIFRIVRKFEQNIALDTVKNEYTFHAAIHQWFIDGEVTTFAEFNKRVYAELFLTPADDPWLGLKGDDYTGVSGNGIK